MTPSPTWTARKRVAAALVAACGLTAAGLLSLSPANADEPGPTPSNGPWTPSWPRRVPGRPGLVRGADGPGPRPTPPGSATWPPARRSPRRPGPDRQQHQDVHRHRGPPAGRRGPGRPGRAGRALPAGLVRGNGNDGRQITVRQLLQQTSGLPDYDRRPRRRLPRRHAAHLLRAARAGRSGPGPRPPSRPAPSGSTATPTTSWPGCIVEKVTGRPLGEEITNRVIEPLGLRTPTGRGSGEQRSASATRTATRRRPSGKLVDVTDLTRPGAGRPASWSPPRATWPVLRRADRRQLLPAGPARRRCATTVAGRPSAPAAPLRPRACSPAPPTAAVAWGHGGDIPGYSTASGHHRRGRAPCRLAVTALATDPAQPPAIDAGSTPPSAAEPGARRPRLLAQLRDGRGGHGGVLLGSAAGDAQRPDDHAVHDDRHATPDVGQPTAGGQRQREGEVGATIRSDGGSRRRCRPSPGWCRRCAASPRRPC